MNGFINVYKEKTYTSHDCVAKLRGILKQKKIGHMGTLDPDACGILPIALGKATRLIELFNDDKKTYRVRMLLGMVTDTLDTSGTVLEKNPADCSEETVRDMLFSFLGEQYQVPPMYSALKKDGKKLYELARAGITIEREARKVVFYDIFDLSFDLPHVAFTVSCSRGTYIRSLCDDLGRKLGCGACMEELERIAVGSFTVDNAYTLSEIDTLMKNGRIEEAVIPMTAGIPGLPEVYCVKDADVLAHNGNPLSHEQLQNVSDLSEEMFWLRDSLGALIGIYKRKGNTYYPLKMVYEDALL